MAGWRNSGSCRSTWPSLRFCCAIRAGTGSAGSANGRCGPGGWDHEAVNDLERAGRAYQAAMFAAETDEAAKVLQDLSGSGPEEDLARGKLRHCANIADRRTDPEELACFERAETGFAERGDGRGTGAALFWRGCYHQVLADDDEAARPLFEG